jgi:O-antigen/teichoic acid export membrane protein
MASNLVVQPVQKLTPILDRVTFPVLAIVQDDTERLRKGYLQMIKVLMAINAPILFGLSAVAPTLVVVWLGYEWSPVITLIPFLAVYSLCRSLGIVGGSLMMARGRADWTLYWNILVLVVSVPAIILSALSSNLVIIAITLMLLQPLLFVLHYLLFVRKLIGDCWHEYYWESIGIPIGFALLMALFIVGTRGIIPELQRVVTLGLQIVLGGIAYGSLLFLFWKQELRTMTHILVK